MRYGDSSGLSVSRLRPARFRSMVSKAALMMRTKRILVGKFHIVIVDQHRGIDLEDHKIAVWIEPAVDAEIIEPEALPHRAQRLIMRGVEDRGGIGEERRFLLLHPGLARHVGRDVVHLPVVADRKMVGQDLFADEDEAVFAEMAIGEAVVDIFDDVMVGLRTPREKAREFIEALEFFEIVPAMRTCRPGQNGERESGSSGASAAG